MKILFKNIIEGATVNCLNCGRNYNVNSGKVQLNLTFEFFIRSFQCQKCGEIDNGNHVAENIIELPTKCVWCDGELRSDKPIFCNHCGQDNMKIDDAEIDYEFLRQFIRDKI